MFTRLLNVKWCSYNLEYSPQFWIIFHSPEWTLFCLWLVIIVWHYRERVILPRETESYFPIRHHLLNTRLGNMKIFGFLHLVESRYKMGCLAISSQILAVDNPMDPPTPEGETLSIFVLSNPDSNFMGSTWGPPGADRTVLAYVLPLPLCAVCNIVLCWTVLSHNLATSLNTARANARWGRDKMVIIL